MAAVAEAAIKIHSLGPVSHTYPGSPLALAGAETAGRLSARRGYGRPDAFAPGRSIVARTAIVNFSGPQAEFEATLCPAVTLPVGEMKRQLAEICGVPVEQQRVLRGTRAVSDEDTLLSLDMPTDLKLVRVQHESHTPGSAIFCARADSDEDKNEAFRVVRAALPSTQWVVYCNNRRRAQQLGERLANESCNAFVLHGDVGPEERASALQQFHDGALRALVLTDAVAPQFLSDMRDVPTILNFDFPADVEDFGRRVFRTGRFTKRGISVSLLSRGDLQNSRDAERFFRLRFRELPLGERERHLIAEYVARAVLELPDGHADRFHRAETHMQHTNFARTHGARCPPRDGWGHAASAAWTRGCTVSS